MKYFEAEEVLVIHARIIDATSGLHGIRDVNIVSSITARPMMRFSGKNVHPTVFDKAATYCESTALFHPFIDGNKRTAIALAARFLYLNGYIFKTSNSAIEQFMLDVAVKKYETKKIASWLKKHSKKIKS